MSDEVNYWNKIEFDSLNDGRLVVYTTLAKSFQQLEMWVMNQYKVYDSWTKTRINVGFDHLNYGSIMGIHSVRLMKKF